MIDKLSLNLTSFTFNKLVDDCFLVINSMKGDKNIKLVNESTSNINLKTDYHRLKRVILNLLTNALKYTTEGYISLSGHLERPIVTVVVKDSGAGMEKEALNKLFKEFASNVENKSEATRSVCNREGIGLGLVTSLNLVEKLGPHRKINVESEKGIGSTFSFQIYQNCETKQEAREKGIPPNADSNKKFTVLEHIIAADENNRVIKKKDSMNSPTPRMHINVNLPSNNNIGTSSVQGWKKLKDAANQASSTNNGSNGRKKIHILIYEACKETIEVRTLLDNFFEHYKTEFAVTYEYASSLDEAMNIIREHKINGITFSLVFASAEKSGDRDGLMEPAKLSKMIIEYYQEQGNEIPSILLINNSALTTPQLKSLWSIEGLLTELVDQLFYEIFDRMPDDRTFNKVMIRWHKMKNFVDM